MFGAAFVVEHTNLCGVAQKVDAANLEAVNVEAGTFAQVGQQGFVVFGLYQLNFFVGNGLVEFVAQKCRALQYKGCLLYTSPSPRDA